MYLSLLLEHYFHYFFIYSSKMAAVFHPGFDATESAVRSADLENPTLEPYMKWIG